MSSQSRPSLSIKRPLLVSGAVSMLLLSVIWATGHRTTTVGRAFHACLDALPYFSVAPPHGRFERHELDVVFTSRDPEGRVFTDSTKSRAYQKKVFEKDIGSPIRCLRFSVKTDERKEGFWSPTAFVREVEVRLLAQGKPADQSIEEKYRSRAWSLAEQRLRQDNVIANEMPRYRSESGMVVWRNARVLVSGLVINTLSVFAVIVLMWLLIQSIVQHVKTRHAIQ